jgi:SOS-response transcriptional repressor LexA
MSLGLTQKQKELLNYLKHFQGTRGYCPSYEEMMHAQGLKSKNGIHRLIKGMLERGIIRQAQSRTRSIEIVDDVAKADPKLPVVKIKIREDGHYMGADQLGEVEVQIVRV